MEIVTDRPNRPLIVKCNYDSSTRRVAFPSASSCFLGAVRARVEECFHLSALSFVLSYTDDDGEDFSIRTEADLTEAILYFASGEDDGPSGSQQKITLKLDVVVEYDGPSLSDTSSLRSFESGTGSGSEDQSEGSWGSTSYYTHGSRQSNRRELEDVDEEEDLEERMTVMDLEGSERLAQVQDGHRSHLDSDLGSRWLREQSSLARRKGSSAVGRSRLRAHEEDEDDSDEEVGDLNLIRDAKGKFYYSYGSDASSSVSGDYAGRSSPRPDIPVTGLAIEPGAPPILAPDCSACGTRLDYMRYVCTTCGEGELWKENAPSRIPPLRRLSGLSEADESEASDLTEYPDDQGESDIYDPRPRSKSTNNRGSIEAVDGGFISPPESPRMGVDGISSHETGYELCPACIEEHGIAHAKASKSKRVSTSSGKRLRRSNRHAFREKIWGLEGWTDIEYNDDEECSICHLHLSRNRYKCVSCPKFDICRICYQRVSEIHPAHAFLSLPDRVVAPAELEVGMILPTGTEIARPVRHPGAFCHNCLQDIVGPRFHCAVCPSWDLCIQCEGISATSGGHTPEHIMMKIPVPIAATQVEAVSRRAREQWMRDSAAASPRSLARSLSPTNETVYASGRINSLDALHHRCRCGGCNEWILGKRYQCANCPSDPESYSLCSVCEIRSHKLHNPLHVFFKFDRPVHTSLISSQPILPILLRNRVGDVPASITLDPADPTAYLRHLLHKETLCDIHADQIRGVWLRCAHCPAGFDICAEAEAGADHDQTHVFVVFKARVDMGKFRELANLGGDRPRALLTQARKVASQIRISTPEEYFTPGPQAYNTTTVESGRSDGVATLPLQGLAEARIPPSTEHNISPTVAGIEIRMEDDPLTPRESPRRQDSALSATSSSGKTVRPSSASSKTPRSLSATGGLFARLRGASNGHTPSKGDIESPTEAGPSDWYRRSPSPEGLPSTWRQPSQDVGRYEFDEGPSDVWGVDSPRRSRATSPIDDERAFSRRIAGMPDSEPEGDDGEEMTEIGIRHPAEADLEQGDNQAMSGAGTDRDDDSDFGARVISPSPSSFSLNYKPFPSRPAFVPAISRLRSHHRTVSSTSTQQSLRPFHARTPSQFSQLSVSSEPTLPADPAFTFHPLRQLSAEVRGARPSVVDVRGMIAVGTETGHVLVYSFAQELKYTLGTDGTLNSGSVTAIRISPDQTYIAVGHASGNIHLWDLAAPSKPARTTLSLTPEQIKTGRKDGHTRGDAVHHIGFVAARHTAIISGDATGNVFWWSLGRVMGIDSNDTIRILGGVKRGKLFAASPLPLGDNPHSTDDAQISALLTPRKLVIVCMKPSPKTLHRRMGDGAVGCAAWLRPGELSPTSDPVLAYSWDARLHFLRVPSFVESKTFEASSNILALQWFDANHILIVLQASVLLLDVRTNVVVEDVPFQTSMVQNMSVSIYREKVFILTKTSLQAGTLKHWDDKILACVHKGDFLGAIHLAIAYYNGTATGNLITVPDKPAVADRIRELVTASLKWAFSEDRMKDDTHYSADGRGVDLTSLFEGLAQSSVEAFLAIEDTELLESTFEAFERVGIHGIFLRHLHPLLSDRRLQEIPPVIVKALIDYHADNEEYDLAEEVIWSVDPLSLDINQAVTLCEKHGLWDALIHVYTRALLDYVTPITKLLGPSMDPTLVYAYLEAILSGVSYPIGEPLPKAQEAQSAVYEAVFGDYLYHLLSNTELFLHVLDGAFEHSFLNDSPTISRQVIINTLLDRSASDLFVQIFISRNLPKYPQFITLPPTTLDRLLRNLAEREDEETREDRQMAVEYLLSAYRPHEYESILQLFEKAGFTRILLRYYRGEKRWTDAANVTLREADADVFDTLEDIFREDERSAEVLEGSVNKLLRLDTARTATLIDKWSPSLHNVVIEGMEDMDQLLYLQQLLEPDHSHLDQDQRHRYVSLLRRYNRDHVIDYLDGAKDIDVKRIGVECERDGFVEGQLWALSHQEDPQTFTIAGNIIRQQGADLGQAIISGDFQHNLQHLEDISKMAIRLANKSPTEDSWFSILLPMVETLQTISNLDKSVSSQLRTLVQSTFLHLLSSGISFPRLFKRLVDETSNTKTSYTEFRTILTGMLGSYRSEGEMLLMSKRLMEADLFEVVEQLSKKRQGGWMAAGKICRCGEEVTEGIVLGSGQMAHKRCAV